MKKTIATPPGQPSIHIDMTEREIQDFESSRSHAPLKHIRWKEQRSQAYEKEIDPFMSEALAEAFLEDRFEKLNALKLVRQRIKSENPKDTLES